MADGIRLLSRSPASGIAPARGWPWPCARAGAGGTQAGQATLPSHGNVGARALRGRCVCRPPRAFPRAWSEASGGGMLAGPPHACARPLACARAGGRGRSRGLRSGAGLGLCLVWPLHQAGDGERRARPNARPRTLARTLAHTEARLHAARTWAPLHPLHACTHTGSLAHTRARLHAAHTRAPLHTCMHAGTLAHVQAPAHACMHIGTLADTRAPLHAHTGALARLYACRHLAQVQAPLRTCTYMGSAAHTQAH